MEWKAISVADQILLIPNHEFDVNVGQFSQPASKSYGAHFRAAYAGFYFGVQQRVGVERYERNFHLGCFHLLGVVHQSDYIG